MWSHAFADEAVWVIVGVGGLLGSSGGVVVQDTILLTAMLQATLLWTRLLFARDS